MKSNGGSHQGKLASNIMHFGRALRQAGLPIGTGQVIDAVEAATHTGLRSREDLYWALHGLFVSRPEQRMIFEQGFHLFWRRPELLERLRHIDLSSIYLPQNTESSKAGSRRLGEAMAIAHVVMDQKQPDKVDNQGGASYREVLGKRDFDKMGVDEIAEAKRVIKNMPLPVAERPTRRYKLNRRGVVIDAQASIRASLRGGGDIMQLRFRRRRWRPSTVVMICDISGSMSRYSRLLLHFAHALANHRAQVHAFVFGTRLTNITRYLRQSDPDVALENALEAVDDWSGGTRIGASLHCFNHEWSRRVLGEGATIVLITDGLERDVGIKLSTEMERLQKSCRRLIWLNPLLRYAGFEAKSYGVRAMLPHVDDFRPAHNLESIASLSHVLSVGSPAVPPK